MGGKKRAAPRRPNLPASPRENPSPSPPRPQPPPFTSPGVSFLVDINPDQDPELDPSIGEDRQRALSSLRKGNTTRGFKIIQETISRCPNSVALLLTRAFMHFHTAMAFEVETRRLQHLRDGVASAEQALALCPNLIGLMVIYTTSLFELAKDQIDYENVVQQCQKGLSIQDPVDPEKDLTVYQKETEEEDRKSKEARIESAKRELHLLIQRSNEIAMEMEKSSKDDAAKEKRSGSRSVGGAGMWERFVSLRKSQEEKRLPIEEQLDQVRRWQHEVYDGGIAKDKKGTEGYVERLTSKVDPRIQVLQYWKGLSHEKQRAFLEVNVSELQKYYSFDRSSTAILEEAMGIMKELRSWKFWECSSCKQRFLDRYLWRQHLDSEDHFRVLSPEEVKILPRGLNAAWLNKIVEGFWRPVDVDKTLKDIVEQVKEKQEVGHDVAGESEAKTKEMDFDEEKWSYCDDAKREGMLKRIRSMFDIFLSNLCLSHGMVHRWLRLTRYELEKKCPNVGELFPYLDKTPLGICFLEYEQLEMLYRMICQIGQHCQMVSSSKDDSFYDEVAREEEYRETIDYTDDFLCLILDGRFLTGEFKHDKNLADEESFVYWLYGGAEIEELVKSWEDVKARKLAIANSAYQFLYKESEILHWLCSKKSLLLNYERAFHVFRNKCMQETHKRGKMPSVESQNLVQLLLQQRDMNKDIREGNGFFVYRVTTDILGDAQAACAEHLGSEGALFGRDSKEPDLGGHEDEEQQMKGRHLDDAERRVLQAVERRRYDMERKHCIVDGFIAKSLADTKRMMRNYTVLTAHDLRAIMLHLLKSFIREILEKSAKKEAREKAQAAEEALLTTLALESDKRKEDEKSTNVGKKSKKKKPFYKRKPEDKVPSQSAETIELEKKKAESFPVASSSSISGSITTDESRELGRQLMVTADTFEDEQLMRLIKSEGMTVEEMIENQRRIEEEIKQVRLGERSMEMSETVSENVEDDVPFFTSTGESEEPSVSEPTQHSQAVTNPGYSICFGTIRVPIIPKSGEGHGSSNRNLPLPTEAYTEPGETNVPPELVQVEKSGPITLPGPDAAEVGDSHPQAGNVGLKDENDPDLDDGVHNPP